MPHAYRTEAADSDLRNIAFQIGIESARPQIADKVVDDLVDCCEQLALLSPLSRLGTAAPLGLAAPEQLEVARQVGHGPILVNSLRDTQMRRTFPCAR